MRRFLHIITVILTLALVGSSCGDFREGRGKEALSLSSAEYYNLGRYACQDEDWGGAIGFFEKSLSVALMTGDYFYQGYSCQRLCSLWAAAYEHSTALEYARSSVTALESCGEQSGACLSRLDMAWQYMYLGEYDEAKKILAIIRANFPSLGSPIVERINQLEELLSINKNKIG